MERRRLLTALGGFVLCPLCARLSSAAEAAGPHWSYEGATGPSHWGALDKESAVCSAGSQQSPLDLTGAVKSDLPALEISWRQASNTIVNNGHTIQINTPGGSGLRAGAAAYELVQFHFHAPSEHHVAGQPYAMEAHFVHRNLSGAGLGVVGVLMTTGGANSAFAQIARAMPRVAGESSPADLDPKGLIPASRSYWRYEGSLTTPPCSEIVDWMVLKQPMPVAQADIDRFIALYPMNARPIQPDNRRFVLSSD
jgi:carbonic anhydrase